MAESTSSLRMPASQILKGEENYEQWKPRMEDILIAKDLDQYVDGTRAPDFPKEPEGDQLTSEELLRYESEVKAYKA